MPKYLHRFFLAVSLLMALPALAQGDPPSRVGRLSHVEGDVGFRTDRRDAGGPATLNWPISSGAVLDTGRPGRAEVWIGSTAYRLHSDSEIEFTVVDDRRVDVRQIGGSLAVSVLDRDQADDLVLATPDGNIRFLTPGRYRINVHGDRSELQVQAGRATFDNGRRVIPVAAGQMATLYSDGNEQLDASRGYDAFDQWVAQRENASLASSSRRHVSPYMTGYQDLDAYGDWRTTGDYGTVWYPRAVASDWAPYRQGRWAWVAPWGWTWVDQAPWGFAPFHYGRWALIAGRWGWVPGRLVPRPVYAPALVGWVGDPGWNVSFSFGSAPAVGWFPLAPREVYVPAYRYSPTYVRQLNVTQVTNVTLIDRAVRGTPPGFAHRALPQAVTVVPARQMQEGRPISLGDIRRPDRRDLERAPLARQAPSAQWVAPAPAASRPYDAERGGQRQRTRDGDFRRNPDAMPAADSRGRPAENAAQPARRDVPVQGAARSMPEGGRDPASDPRREFFRRQQEGRPDNGGAPPDSRRDERSQPGITPAEREQRRDFREQRQERQFRPPEGLVTQQAGPRDTPRSSDAVAPNPPARREMPASDMRRDDRPQSAFNSQDRDQRREMRDMQRMERPPQAPSSIGAPQTSPPRELSRSQEAPSAPAQFRREERSQPAFQMQEREQRREMPRQERQAQPQPAPLAIPQAMPPREMPRPAPEVRMPLSQPAAPPPQRAEPPRQQAAPQGGNEQHRRRDEERGQR